MNNTIEYKAKINGRGKLKLYGYTPKFFCVFYIEGLGEKKAMISVSDHNMNRWGNLFSNDPISTISKGDTVSFMFDGDITNIEWLNVDSYNITILDNSGTKKWNIEREQYRKQMKQQQDAEFEREREIRRVKNEKRIAERKELYKKYQQWYFKEYNSKTTGSNILKMYNVLNLIEHVHSLIGVRGKKGFYTGGDWNRPTGLYANVFHGLNQNIVNKALNELTENEFAEFKIYKVIQIESHTRITTETKQKGIRIMKKGHIFLTKFRDFKYKKIL